MIGCSSRNVFFVWGGGIEYTMHSFVHNTLSIHRGTEGTVLLSIDAFPDQTTVIIVFISLDNNEKLLSCG